MSFRLDLDRIDRRRLVPGLILIGVGILGLFGSFGWLRGAGGLVGAILFGAAAYFAFLQGRHSGALLWRAGAFALAGLAIASVAPGSLGGFAFLGSIGLAFALVWRDDPRRWWAVIPAGTLLSLALTALVDGATRAAGAGGAVFFFGLAATFFVLTRLPQHAQPWGIYPAAALALLAVVVLTTSGGWIVPLLLIAAGAWMLLRHEGARGAVTGSATTSTAPTANVPATRAPVESAAPVVAAATAPVSPAESATLGQPAEPQGPAEGAAERAAEGPAQGSAEGPGHGEPR